ncbi:MAG: DUF4274 domain-containing protein, partial [Pseudomonadota bacterium]
WSQSKNLGDKYPLWCVDIGMRAEDIEKFNLMTGWLKQQPQDSWLIFASSCNFDFADNVLKWMVDQPECDRSVAARILWWLSPSYYHVSGNLKFGGEFVVKIIENYHAGFYRKNELFLDPYELLPEIQCYASDLSKLSEDKLMFTIPDELFGPFNGRDAVIPSTVDVQGNEELRKMFNLFDTVMYQTANETSENRFQSEQKFKEVYQLPNFSDEPREVGYIERLYGSLEDYNAAREVMYGPRRVAGMSPMEQNKQAMQISKAFADAADDQIPEGQRSLLSKLIRSLVSRKQK